MNIINPMKNLHIATIGEDFAAGPLRWVRTKLNDLVLHLRNRETLARLSDIATRQKPEQ